MRNKRTPVLIKELICMFCHKPREIPRRKGKNKKTGHIKHMFCNFCQVERPFAEK